MKAWLIILIVECLAATGTMAEFYFRPLFRSELISLATDQQSRQWFIVGVKGNLFEIIGGLAAYILCIASLCYILRPRRTTPGGFPIQPIQTQEVA